MLSSLSTENLARASAAHPVRVILAWAIAFVAGAALFVAFFEDAVTTEFKFIGNPESERADTLLQERLRGPEAIADVVIVRSDTVTVDDPIFRETVENLVGRIRALGPEIVGGVDPFYETGDQSQVSESRRSTFIPVVLTGDLNDAETNVEEVHKVLDEATSPAGFEVFMTGEATIGHEFTTTSEEDLLKGETFGGAIAIVILTIVFGAIAAMVLPIALAIMSIVIALGVVALVGQAFELNFFVQNIITMIGLAVGIDYSLFIVSRYREERTRGVEVREAIVIAGGTASRAVLFSGFMVVLALIGLLIVPHTVFFSLGLGAILVVIAAVMAGLTLLPALLIVMGDNVNRLSIRIPGLRKKCEGADCCDEGHEEGHYGYWDRFSRAVMKVPVLSLVVTVGILVAASVAYFDINIGTSGVSSFPEDFRGRQGFEVLQSEFGFGLDAPAEIVIEGDIRSAPIQEAIARLTTTLDADERFGSATLETNQANDLTVLTVPLVGDPTSGPTIEAVETLRDEYIPAAFSGV